MKLYTLTPVASASQFTCVQRVLTCSIAHAGHIRAVTSSHWSQSLKDSVNSCMSKYHRRNRNWALMLVIWLESWGLHVNTSGKEEREDDCGIRVFFTTVYRLHIAAWGSNIQISLQFKFFSFEKHRVRKLKLYISSSLSDLWERSNIKQASKKKKSTYQTIKGQRLRKPKRFSMGSNRN